MTATPIPVYWSDDDNQIHKLGDYPDEDAMMRALLDEAEKLTPEQRNERAYLALLNGKATHYTLGIDKRGAVVDEIGGWTQ